MIVNLFSMFDGSSYSGLFGYSGIGHPLAIFHWISVTYWVSRRICSQYWLSKITYLYAEISLLHSRKNFKVIVVGILTIFFYLFSSNFYSLMPANFCVHAQIPHSLFSLILWLGFLSYCLTNFLSNFFSHLIPFNTPFVLIHFMVLVELISNMIRPFTLTIRIVANLTAGHLILNLISSAINEWNLNALLFFCALTVISIIEVAVRVIQSYIFMTLLILYYTEIRK